MAVNVQTIPFTPAASTASLNALEAVLRRHLPFSLPLFRRTQYARYRGAVTEWSRVIFVSGSSVEEIAAEGEEEGENGVEGGGEGGEVKRKFTAAYVDVSGGPETQMWLFSTLEIDPSSSSSSASERKNGTIEGVYTTHLTTLTATLIALAKSYPHPLTHKTAILLGTLHERVRALLEVAFVPEQRVTARESGVYDKWTFDVESIPVSRREDEGLGGEDGLRLDGAREGDFEVVVSRTDIPRTPNMLRQLPSLFIRNNDDTPVAWAFLGLDGSLISLHCEPAYRRRGLAKLIGSRLMRQGPGDFSRADGWCSADVAPQNEGSRAMCRSLGGVPRWRTSWVLFDVTENDIESSL